MATRRTSLRGLEPETKAQPDATGLNAQQERALALLVAGNRVGSVAKALGVDRATIWRWTKLRPFRRQLGELRGIARRDLVSGMRRNVLLATRVLGEVLRDRQLPARDRIFAARVVLGSGAPQAAEIWDEGPATPELSNWREVMIDTARRAAELGPGGPVFVFARTPAAAWKESGLARALPHSFERVRALSAEPERLAAECEQVLSEFQDLLDNSVT